MPEKMPEKNREFIEAECLKVARVQQGCSDLGAVRIGRTRPSGSGQIGRFSGSHLSYPHSLRATLSMPSTG